MGRPPGASTPLAPNITRVPGGYIRLRASVGSGAARRTREQRLPPGDYDLAYLKAQHAQLEAELRDEMQQQAPEHAPTRGTLAADVQTYLKRMYPKLDPATFRSRASELKAWCDVLGERARHTLRLADVERAIAAWQTPPKHARPVIVKKGKTYKPRPWVKPSAKTIQNRVRSLRHLYRVLDGKRARTPADDYELPKRVKTRPRAIDVRTIRTVIANLIRQERRGRLRDAKTRARFLVMVTTGQRPTQIARATHADVSLEQRVWYVSAAKGGEEVPLPLNGEMVAAWQLFIAAQAWGTWDSRSFARTLRRAGWPVGVRPYNARHSVGIALSEAGVDLGDIQPFLGHSRLETTRAFYVPGLSSRLKAASDKLDKRVEFSPVWARYVGTPPEQRRKRNKSRKSA